MKKTQKIPLRQCMGCREMKNKKELLRVLRTSEGEVFLDLSGRQNGRGAYVCRCKECFVKARKNHSFERSLKTVIPEEVYDKLEKEMAELGLG